MLQMVQWISNNCSQIKTFILLWNTELSHFNHRLFLLASFPHSVSDPVIVQVTKQPVVAQCILRSPLWQDTFKKSQISLCWSKVKDLRRFWELSLCFRYSMVHNCITCGILLVFSVKIEVIFLLWAGSKRKTVFYPLRTYLLLFSQAVFPGIRE